MVRIPDSKVLVIGGSLKPGMEVHLSIEIDGNKVIKPTILVGWDQDISAEPSLDVQFDEIAPSAINCKLDFRQDVMLLNPRDMELHIDTSNTSDLIEYLDSLAEIAFMRSLRLVRFEICEWQRRTYLKSCRFALRGTKEVFEEVFMETDEVSALAHKYFLPH